MTGKIRGKSRARGPGRLSAEETEQLEEGLLDAAERVFLELGYARATMDAVAKAAGITRKTLYARYANKEEMFAAVIDRLLDDPPETPGSQPPNGEQEPRVALARLARELIAMVETPRTARLSRLVYAEAAQAPELVRLSTDLYVRLVDYVRPTLESLCAAGHLPKMPDLQAAAALFIEMVASNARSRAILGQPMPRKQLAEQVDVAVLVFLRGCGENA